MVSKIPNMHCNFPLIPSRSSNSKILNSGSTECKQIRQPIRELLFLLVSGAEIEQFLFDSRNQRR